LLAGRASINAFHVALSRFCNAIRVSANALSPSLTSSEDLAGLACFALPQSNLFPSLAA